MIPADRPRTPREKALAVNLDSRRYGTFAEIGAGQEVVRWFFQAGGAAGTISKSISAYDMVVSDAIYGKTDRYVSRERLQRMLDYEHHLNHSRLREKRSDTTAFFAFADTVAAKSFKGNSESHGWMGIKFQSHPRDEDSQITIHVRMLDNENALQQEALGIVGVNLVYGACFLYHEPEDLIDSLFDNLSTSRLEIDMVTFDGIEFRHVDNRVMSLRLVQKGFTPAALFGSEGEILQPSEVLYKKPVLVERGSFRPVTRVHTDMLQQAMKKFCLQPDVADHKPVALMEITMRNLMADGNLDLKDFLARADTLASTGQITLVSDYFEFYRLAAYIRRYTNKPLGITMGIANLQEIFKEHHYENLEGGILESFGRLFKHNTKLYIYPMLKTHLGHTENQPAKNSRLITLENLPLAKEVQQIFNYLFERGYLESIEPSDLSYLSILSSNVLSAIKSGQDDWKSQVPDEVYNIINERNLFKKNS